MAFLRSEAINLAPTTSGALVVSTTGTYNGYLKAVQFTPSTSAPTSTGGLLGITGARTGLTLFSIANLATAGTFLPRLGTVLSTDATVTSTGSGSPPIFNEQLTITVTSGSTGGAKAAVLRLFVE